MNWKNYYYLYNLYIIYIIIKKILFFVNYRYIFIVFRNIIRKQPETESVKILISELILYSTNWLL